MPNNIGPYEIRGELGRGAMAVVWRGYDSNLEREVAIKEPVMPAGIDSATTADLSARFVREGRAAAKLGHPGIVTIFNADIYDGRPAIVMELIEGETLADILDRGPLEPQSAIAVTDQLLDAVGYAHTRGVVHRDIKPDNIFITHDGRVKLTDFGIAHVGGGETSGLTQAGTVMGTPGYMAPEQITGLPVDARTDLFAVGVILHEMLVGQNPFGATEGAAPTTVMYRIVHEAAPVIPDPVIGAIPFEIARITATAMAKDPAYRFGDAQAFRTALSGGPIQAGGQVVIAPTVASATLGATSFATPSAAAGSKGWTPYIIVGAVGVLILGGLLLFSGGGGVGSGGAVSPGGIASGGITTGPTTVRLEWDSSADMDLEIWDSQGDEYLCKAYEHTGSDVMDGYSGSEYFEFADYTTFDCSDGWFVVSPYFCGGSDTQNVTLTLVQPDGTEESWTKSFSEDTSADQWHAIRVNAATGEYEVLDHFVGPTVVRLEWDSSADLDLEIWDGTGDTYLCDAYEYTGWDVTDGWDGAEYFEFEDYGSENFSSGWFVVSPYFCGGGEVTNATLTLYTPSGEERSWNRTVYMDVSADQWHAIRVNAATGEYETIDFLD